jgi:nucleoside-diphosphate-sugar epimerase
MRKEKVLIMGACGQIGVELTLALRKLYGTDNVIASDIRDVQHPLLEGTGPYYKLDAMDAVATLELIKKESITQVYLLAALLSATGEKAPKKAWDINMQSLLQVLDIAVQEKLTKIYWPSSIAVFGSTTPRQDTPQKTVIEPRTVYGISKYAGELWCQYYNQRWNLDVRSLRYPGLISWKSEPGGGTTDYAVEIYHEALKHGKYTSFLSEGTYLPMMYMDDAIRGTIELMEAPEEKIKSRMAYNLSAMSFSPKEIAAAIQKHIPDFQISYAPDFRQQIADGWPQSIDDSVARADWGWKPEYDLEKMTADMLLHLKAQLQTV